MGFELAPAAVLRVASWPAHLLDDLQEFELAEIAASTAPPSDDSFCQVYEAAIERQRRALASMTIHDERFRCALALATPRLARALDGWPSELPRRNKRVRHVETSLMRYLARAVGRPDPAGLWTGVTLATFGASDETTFAASPPRVSVAPELQPFREAFAATCERAPYRRRGRFRINATLQRGPNGWIVGRRAATGSVTWIDLPSSPLWPLLAEFSGGEATSVAALERALAQRLGVEVGAAAVDLARSAGALVGGPAFPGRFGSVLDALERAEAQLHQPERDTWATCRRIVLDQCESLAQHLSAAAQPGGDHDGCAAEVLEVNDAVRVAVTTMVADLGLDPIEVPEAMLRADLLAPFTAELGRRDGTEIRRIMADWEQTERRGDGLRRHRERADALFGGGDRRALFGPNRRATGSAAEDTSAALLGPPLGALVLRPASPAQICGWVRGVSDVPTATHARHAERLRILGDPLLPWFRLQFAALSARTGVQIVDLVTDAPSSPNVGARPAYVDVCLRPWSEDDIGLGPTTTIRRGPHRDAPVVDHAGGWLAAFAFSAASPPAGDPIVARLLATSFSPLADEVETGPRRPAPGPTADERQDRRSTDGGRPVVPATTVVARDQREVLRQAKGAQRYRAWIRLSRMHAWPDVVRVVRGTRPALLIATSSPLAVEAAFEGFDAERLIVEEVLDGAWGPGAGDGCRVELVVPVKRQDHLWCGAMPSESVGHDARV